MASRWCSSGRSGWLMSCTTERGQVEVAGSVASIAARGLNSGQLVEIDLDDGLQSLGRRRVLKAFRQSGEPATVIGLQSDQFTDCLLPTLWSAAVRWLGAWPGDLAGA